MRVGVTGHQDIPSAGRPWIEEQVRILIAQSPRLIGVSSLAKGADQLFARSVLAAGNPLEAVIPCRDYASTFDPLDVADYLDLLGRAEKVVTLDFGPPSEEAFLAAGQRVADSVDQVVAIWDGEEAQGRGGTADMVRYARSIGVPVTVLWPPGLGAHGDEE